MVFAGGSSTTYVLHQTGCSQEDDQQCVKDASGRVQQEGKIGSTRCWLDCWMKTLSQPWTVAMEAMSFRWFTRDE
jgi:hypothetical protein